MRIANFRLTRFQFARDRVIGDSQVRADDVNLATLELISDTGLVGLGFMQSLFFPMPDLAEIERVFRDEAWRGLADQEPAALAHRVARPRGGNIRRMTLPFEEAIQHAVWDLFAKGLDMPLWRLLGARRTSVKAYASGLDYHLSDEDFVAFFAHAEAIGYDSFKIKVGHPEIERDLRRLDLLKKTVRPGSTVMIDANEAWSPKEAVRRLDIIRRAGHDILWIEDPTLRNDFEGLKLIRTSCPWTLVNSGEYLDASGKRTLMEAGGVDILNVHGQVTDVMRIGWLAADHGIPVSLGNTFLELGVHMALALPEVDWLEYSFQNFDHLVEETMPIVNGRILAPERPGHGLVLSETARRDMACPTVLPREQLHVPPQRAAA
jgi:L-alanine-DL-glutamate epimerase-like enolase superfamily enzyme